MTTSFRDYYNGILRETNHMRELHRAGETIPVHSVQILVRHINYVLERFPVGSNQEGLPEDAYNQLINLKEVLEERLRSYEQQNGGVKKYRKKRRKTIKKSKSKRKYRKSRKQ